MQKEDLSLVSCLNSTHIWIIPEDVCQSHIYNLLRRNYNKKYTIIQSNQSEGKKMIDIIRYKHYEGIVCVLENSL